MTQKEIEKFLTCTKVYVNGKSREIQEKLFSLGYKWSAGYAVVDYTDEPFLYIGKDMSLTHSSDMEYFSNHWHREISADEILSLELTTTREEEIDAMAHRYSDNILEIAEEFCKEDMYSAYVVGAMWADIHPKNVWHDASEEPQGEDWTILCDDANNDQCIASPRCDYNWEKFVKSQAITRWAYVKDLLPKGCEK